MKELSLHILDVAENSLRAGSSLVEITINESIVKNTFEIIVKDDGCGMTNEYAQKILDPFVTERTTRKVGMGIPLFAATAQSVNGDLKIESALNVGTIIKVNMDYNHIDRPPLGDIAGTIASLVCNESETHILYTHRIDDLEFQMDTRLVKEAVGDLPLCNIGVINWIEEYIKENETIIREEINNEISS